MTLLGVPLGELAWLGAAILVAGVVTGLLAGLFGIGGGSIIVPVLYEVFGVLAVPDAVRIQLAIGTSLAIIVPTNIRSYLAHRAKGAVVAGIARQWGLPAIVGVMIGAAIAAVAPKSVIISAFIAFCLVIAVKLLFGRDSWRIAETLPGPVPMALYGGTVGLASSLMGVSGGSTSNMILTLHGIPIHNAVATSAAVGVPITVVGTIGYAIGGLAYGDLLPPLSVGFVSLVGVALMAPVSTLVAPLGARLAHALPRRRLEVAFGCFLLAVCVRFVFALL